MLKKTLYIVFMIWTTCLSAQEEFKKDTSYLRINKMPDDTVKVLELFSKGLETSVYDLDLSGFYARECYDLAERLKYEKGIIRACDMLGNYYMQTGSYGKSYHWMSKSIRLKEKNNDHFGLAIGYNQLAVLFRLMENFKMAKVFSKKSIEQSRILKSDKFIALSTSSLSNIYYENKEYDSALYYNQQAYELHLSSGDSTSVALSLSNRGVMYLDLKDYDKTIEMNLRAYDYLNKVDLRQILICEINLASAYIPKNELGKAELCFEKIFPIAAEFAEADQVIMINKLYAEFLFKKGKYKEAYEYNTKYQLMKDSVDDVTANSKVSELETRYQTEKKEKENLDLKQKGKIDRLKIIESEQKSFLLKIILVSSLVVLLLLILFFVSRVKTSKKLAIQNEQINKQNNTLKSLNKQLIEGEEQLQRSNDAKAQLISVISHDISSPVNSLFTYQQGILSQLDKLSKEELVNNFEKINAHTKQVHSLVNNLLDYSFTQQNGFVCHYETFNLYAMVIECLQLFQQQAVSKSLRIEAKEIMNIKVTSDKNLLRLVVRNLISNAIKYSPEKGTITFRLDAVTKKFLVCDEGAGMNEQKKQMILKGNNQHSDLGTAGEKGTGLGMKIVKNAVSLLKTEMIIENNLPKGTSIGLIISSPGFVE